MKLQYLGNINSCEVIQKLDKDQFIPEYPIDWKRSLWWVIKDKNNIVAYLAAEFDNPKNSYFYLSRSFVVEKYRGQGLHKRLIKAAVRWARNNGFKTAWSSINLWNYASGNSLISCGFKLCKPVSNDWKEQLIFFDRKLRK